MKDSTICPKCDSENTYQLQDWLGQEVRVCENIACKCIYTVKYKIIVESITIKE